MTQQLEISFDDIAGKSAPRRRGYPSYKQSGVGWIPRIPASWTIKRLKFAATFPAKSEVRGFALDLQVSFVPMEAVGEYGGLRLTETRSLEDVLSGYTFFKDDDVVVAKITPCFENGKGALARGLEGGIAFGTTELHVLRAVEFVPEFLFYLTISRDFRELGSAEMYGAGGQKRVPERFLRDIRHPIPPLDEQRTIVAFLDRETARIGRLIADKTRLIELLAENRAAVISHAVTGAIRICNNGEWCEMQIGKAIKLQRGFDITGADHAEGNVPVISSGGFSGYCDVPIVRGPGVIVGRKGTLGTVHYAKADYWPHDTTLWVKEFRGNYPRFVYYFLIHMNLKRFDVGAANPTVNRNHVHPIVVSWPDKDAQRGIAEYLDATIERLAKLSSTVTVAINRLREYRSALITAAMTGKIDVRRTQAGVIK
jgi:type I restriction enzyme, S subunit